MEGNEYSFKFITNIISGKKVVQNSRRENIGNKPPTLPGAEIILRLRIENIGVIGVDILSISGRIDFTDPYNFMMPDAKNIDEQLIVFPLHLDPQGIYISNLVASIYPFSALTDAQVAVRSRNIISSNIRAKGSIQLEMTDQKGNLYKAQLSLDLSLRPLCDLYISHWQTIDNHELMRLSTGYNGE